MEPIRACFGVRGILCCGALPQGLCKAQHDPSIRRKQFMMCVWRPLDLWRHFILPHIWAGGVSDVQFGVCVCMGASSVPVHYHASRVRGRHREDSDSREAKAQISEQGPSLAPTPALVVPLKLLRDWGPGYHTCLTNPVGLISRQGYSDRNQANSRQNARNSAIC